LVVEGLLVTLSKVFKKRKEKEDKQLIFCPDKDGDIALKKTYQ
jgi:hypothetical protein